MRRAPLVVLNSGGKTKPQRMRFTPEKTDTVPVYGVLSSDNPQHILRFKVHRLSDGAVIDSMYVKHD